MLKKIESGIRRWILGEPLDSAYFLDRLVPKAQPADPCARVIITALTDDGLRANGKSSANAFFPSFCTTLRGRGFETLFCRTQRDLQRALKTDLSTVIVHVYGEDHQRILSDAVLSAEQQANLVFNAAEIGPLIADKDAASRHFSTFDVPMPEIVPTATDTIVFSNDRHGTSEPSMLVGPGEATDPGRYNTRFIDTTVRVGEADYYTTVRVVCINDRILHSYVRARPVLDGNPNVHAHDTPRDADLLCDLQDRLVTPNTDRFQQIAQAVYCGAGPGFYAHDLIIEASTGRIYMCETNLKFDDPAFWRHLEPIADRLPCHAPLFPPSRFAQRSAEVFADICAENLPAPAGV